MVCERASERERGGEPEITQVYDVKTKLKGEKEKKEKKKQKKEERRRKDEISSTPSSARSFSFVFSSFLFFSLRRVSRLSTRCTSLPLPSLSASYSLSLFLDSQNARETQIGEVDVCEDVFIMARVKTIRATCLDVSGRGVPSLSRHQDGSSRRSKSNGNDILKEFSRRKIFGERQRGSNILGTGSSGQKTCERERASRWPFE